MLLLPIETPGHQNDCAVIILDAGNLERMKAADYVDIVLSRSGKTLVNPTLFICYEEPTPEFERLLQGGDVLALLAYLSRGYKFSADKGDGGPWSRIGDGN
jgi:hypothetical protein